MPVSGWFGLRAEEGRAKLRKAAGRRKESVNRGYLNRTSVLPRSKSVRMGNPPK